jgi:hypothetical protein
MALVLFSALVSAMKGSVGGTTFQNSQGGHCIKNKGRRLARTGYAPQNVKQAVALVTQTWQTLTPAQRMAWAGVKNIWIAVDKFNQSKVLSGYAIYLRCNLRLVINGQDMITYPTSILPISQPAFQLVNYVDPISWEIQSAQTANANEEIIVQMGVAASIASNYPKTGYRTVFRGGWAVSTPIDVGASYYANFGIPPIGSAIWIRIRVINTISGQMSVPQYLQQPIS